ncbi:hypothetical protein TRIP_E380013 [uncultured Spirochaetota bacterium]|nr:hypothetical protein TRIP_E380013 [uncultured Spirochaetota bacterium]
MVAQRYTLKKAHDGVIGVGGPGSYTKANIYFGEGRGAESVVHIGQNLTLGFLSVKAPGPDKRLLPTFHKKISIHS